MFIGQFYLRHGQEYLNLLILTILPPQTEIYIWIYVQTFEDKCRTVFMLIKLQLKQ